MHPTLKLLNDELSQLVVALQGIGSNEPFSIAHGTWNIAGTTRDELVQRVSCLLSLIADRGGDQLALNEALVADYPRRLFFYVQAPCLSCGAEMPHKLCLLF